MRLQSIEGEFSVCKLRKVEDASFRGPFVSLTATEEEISLVCLTKDVPENCTEREDGWSCIKIAGILDFSLVGILSRISGILAENGISIFAVSTFNTDYILLKQENRDHAAAVLREHGYDFS